MQQRNAPFATTYVRDDTERTELVTTTHNSDPCADTFPTDRCNVSVGFIAVKTHRNERFILIVLRKQCGQGAIRVWAKDKVEVRCLIEQMITMMLSHTAGESKANARMPSFMVHQLAESFQNPFFGMLANGAGIEQNHVSVVRGFGRFITVWCKQADQ